MSIAVDASMIIVGCTDASQTIPRWAADVGGQLRGQ